MRLVRETEGVCRGVRGSYGGRGRGGGDMKQFMQGLRFHTLQFFSQHRLALETSGSKTTTSSGT